MTPKSFSNSSLPIVCIQGLGFVGAAMAISVASARDPQGHPIFNVFGVDLQNPVGSASIAALNEGRFPIDTNDSKLRLEFTCYSIMHQKSSQTIIFS